MKARIVKDGNFWIGKVYGKWIRCMMGVPMGEWEGWNTVTSRCFTKAGARLELMNWKSQNCGEEFEI